MEILVCSFRNKVRLGFRTECQIFFDWARTALNSLHSFFFTSLMLSSLHPNFQVRTYRGHVNERNFIGLSVNSEYIACGSETNEVVVYHKVI